MDLDNILQQIAIFALPVLTAITLHEVAHGWAARSCGDRTAEAQGRLSLNPLKHVELVGTILVPGFLLLVGASFLFGWAKPVPVNPRNFRSYRADWIKVAAAGPGANFAMAVLWGLLMVAVARWGSALGGDGVYAEWLSNMGFAGVQFNLVLAVFNLVPIPPLDGGRVLTNLLPPRSSAVQLLEAVAPYGLFIVLGLVATGVLTQLIAPPIKWLMGALLSVLGMLT